MTKSKIAVAAAMASLLFGSSSVLARRCRPTHAPCIVQTVPTARVPTLASNRSLTRTDKNGIIRNVRGEPVGVWGIDGDDDQ